jgi:hypothetical protein
MAEDRLVLLQQFGAHFRIFRLGDCILDICFFQAVQRPYHTVDLSKGVEQIPLCGGIGELDFLVQVDFGGECGCWSVAVRCWGI